MKWITDTGEKTNLKFDDRTLHKSIWQDGIKAQIKKLFPLYNLYEEVSVPHTGLFFDLVIPNLNLVIEMDSGLHDKFNKHFHESYHNFIHSQSNDKKKDRICALNNVRLVRLKNATYDDDELKQIVLGE